MWKDPANVEDPIEHAVSSQDGGLFELTGSADDGERLWRRTGRADAIAAAHHGIHTRPIGDGI
ncbi:hypothetical protein GCM10009720_04870 [Yaniella flava]|uniref:Uncharacterized protein n=1 Tax=Yaniella flava TaxID=287930 RepID=A0ABN2U3Z9_9MICC